jgi:protein-tyrosine phosphatase
MGMTRIWERLYLGSLDDAAQLAADNPFGITTVLSLCSHKVPRKAKGISYTRIPIADSRPISARQFDAVMAAIAQGVRHGYLLIHCVGGISRSPIMTAAWLHRCGCMHLVAALLAIRERRPVIDPSLALLRSVAVHLSRDAPLPMKRGPLLAETRLLDPRQTRSRDASATEILAQIT